LFGNGMVFTRQLLTGRRWSGHLVEDAEFHDELLLDGHRVTFVPGAVLFAEMPSTLEQATSQNERWEAGRVDLARRYVPRFAKQMFTSPRRATVFADAILDHLVPPLSALAAIQGLSIVTAAAASVRGHRFGKRALMVNAAAAVVVGAHAFAGLASVKAPVRYYRALVGSPRIIAWKAMLWASVAIGGREVSWTRTRRNTETSR
jgi:hypothetical protein